MNKTYLAFDYGRRSIGIAVGQTITRTATALKAVSANKGVPDWRSIDAVVKEWQPTGFVVGLPLNMDGTTQWITEVVQAFSAELIERFDLPVYEVDERLSTVAAREQLFEQGGYRALEKGAVDSESAKIILESWLSHNDPVAEGSRG